MTSDHWDDCWRIHPDCAYERGAADYATAEGSRHPSLSAVGAASRLRPTICVPGPKRRGRCGKRRWKRCEGRTRSREEPMMADDNAPDVDAMLTEEGPGAVQAELERLRAADAEWRRICDYQRETDDLAQVAVGAWRVRAEAAERKLAERDTVAMVREFHERFLCPVRETPTVDVPEAEMRLKLVREESRELHGAVWAGDLIGTADALADLVYVVYGAALTFGIDLDAVIAEVHRSNMSKLGEDGRPVLRDDGKILKGPNYSPPDLRRILDDTGDTDGA